MFSGDPRLKSLDYFRQESDYERQQFLEDEEAAREWDKTDYKEHYQQQDFTPLTEGRKADNSTVLTNDHNQETT